MKRSNSNENKLEEEKIPKQLKIQRRKCPYLDTINIQYLDFDFEKVCSISLSNQNIYACLVCGKYFQGRGKNTHAYTHSLQMSHHVFINLHNDRIYCLPDNYEVIDNSLKPIKDALRPTFTTADITKLDQNRSLVQDTFGVAYLPGFVGLNNLKNTDYINVVIHALAHVPRLRDYFLLPSNYEKSPKSSLVVKFGEMIRKLWSPYNIKNTISPHEIVQEISVASKKKFSIGEQHDCIEFLSWFLNELHKGLGGTKKSGSSIIHQVFQGFVSVETLEDQVAAQAIKDNSNMKDDMMNKNLTPLLFLSLDLPPSPLFKDSQGGNIIPQVPLFNVLEKFNGKNITNIFRGGLRQRKRYELKKLPPYIIFHIARFTKNNFFLEKNPTIVNFPLKHLELKDYVNIDMEDQISLEEVEMMSINELKKILEKRSISYKDCIEKQHLINRVKENVLSIQQTSTRYDLIVNVCHDSPPGRGKEGTSNVNPLTEGCYRVDVQNQATGQWYEIQDLHVKEALPELIGLSESYLLIYQRK